VLISSIIRYLRPVLLSESPTVGPVHRRILALAFLGWMFDFYDLILYTFLTRPISAELGMERMDHSLALGLSFLATAVGGVVGGALADRYGRRRMVSWTILLYSAGSLLSGLSPTRNVLFCGRMLTGLGVGGEWAAGHALVAETFPPASRGRAGAILQLGAPVGVGLATLVGTFAVPHIGWRAALVGSSVTALLAFVARRWMPESDLWQAGRSQKRTSIIDVLADPRFYFAFILTAVNGASYWLTYSWMPEYLRSRGLTLAQSGRQMAVIVFGEICGYASFGFFSDKLGRRPAFSLFALIMAVGLVPLTFYFRGGALWFWCATWLVGFGTGTWSNFGPLLAELFPTEARTTSMGTILNVSRAAQFGAPILIATLEPRFGLAAGTGLAAACAALAALLVWLLPETRGSQL
jgi:MFS family permease